MMILPVFVMLSSFFSAVSGETNYTYGVDVVCMFLLKFGMILGRLDQVVSTATIDHSHSFLLFSHIQCIIVRCRKTMTGYRTT